MKTPPPYPKDTILVTEVGSTAHGTGLGPTVEDHDEMVIFVESERQVFSVHPDPERPGPKPTMWRTQPEGVSSGPGDTDRSIYSLRRFLHLAAKGNPSILMAFWSPTLEPITQDGLNLRRLAPSFISKLMIPRYRGYMQSQASRILGTSKGQHGKRGNGGRTELIEAHGYDTKYAMHCARLGLQCVELINTGALELPMPEGHPAGDWLRSVRRGEIPFDAWWAKVLQLDGTLTMLYNNPPAHLRAEPDYAIIERFSALTHATVWEEESPDN